MIKKLMVKYLNKKGFVVLPYDKPLVELHKLDIRQIDKESVIKINSYGNNLPLVKMTDSYFHS